MIDFHNHVIPGVDDGAEDAAQARAALGEMHGQGVTDLVATPHLSGLLTRDPGGLAAYIEHVDRGWRELEAIGAELPGLRLLRGAEVMLDTPSPDLSDPRIRLAGTAFVLVEFPFMSVPPNAPSTLFEVKMQGWTPVLAHPERYANVRADGSDAEEWARVGAVLQVNAGSLLGRYGDRVRTVAWKLLSLGMASYIGSDYHARGRCHLAECVALLESRGAGEQARLLTEVNPRRLLDGEPPLPVQPVTQPSVWRRIFGR